MGVMLVEAEPVSAQLLLLVEVEVHTPSAPPVREAVLVDCMLVLRGGTAAAGVGEKRLLMLKAFMVVLLLPMNRKRGSSRWRGTIRC